MKKLSLILALLVLITTVVSCKVQETTKDVISENKAEENNSEVSQNEENLPEKVKLTLYFPDNDALYLHPEIREVELEKEQQLCFVVLEELFKGPTDENLSPSLDGEDLVNSVTVNDGICTIDFASDFALLNSGGTTREAFAIGSIVNSLCELDGIEEVKINIDGNKNAEFGGHFTLESTFLPQSDLIAKQ